MAVQTDTELDVKLAVYMERLDSYIESQTKLNDTLCARFEEMGEELDEIKHWKLICHDELVLKQVGVDYEFRPYARGMAIMGD